MQSPPLEVVIIQRLCPHYRIPLFRSLNQQEGINITVLVNDPNVADWNKEGIGFNLVYLPALTVGFSFGVKKYHIPVSFSLIKHLRQVHYDVIISEGATNIVNNLFIYPLARLYGSKYVWWGAGRRRDSKRNVLRKVADPLIRYLIKSADANIAYGSVARDYMISVGTKPQKIFIAQNTIDTTPIFNSKEGVASQVSAIRKYLGITNEKVILYVGAIERRKKIENLILAYQEALKLTDQSMTLVIVGGGAHLKALKKWSNTEFSSLDIYFTGPIIEGVGAYFSMCDVFVLPSEGGLALNQAMAYGKPIIATSADGTEVDLIEQSQNGLLVEEDDVYALSDAILRIIQAPVKQKQMGEKSIQLMNEKFTLGNMINNFDLAIQYCLR